jgi:tetratricopeptide (TPR) repeat protein
MRKILLLVLLLVGTAVYGQMTKIVEAESLLEKNNMAGAKEAIDIASRNNRTADDARTWLVKSTVYGISMVRAKQFTPENVTEVLGYFDKAKENDYLGEFDEEIWKRVSNVANNCLSSGVQLHKQKKHRTAIGAFKAAIRFSEYMGEQDGLATYYGALSFEGLKESESAVEWYQNAIYMDFKPLYCYRAIANIQIKNGDHAAAELTLDSGRILFPDDQKLMLLSFNVMAETERFEEAGKFIFPALEKDPGNKVLNYTTGTLMEAQNQTAEAINYYKKAIALDSNYYEPQYNLGIMLFNLGADLVNEKSETAEEREAKSQKAGVIFYEALPYLENTYAINSKDPTNKKVLKQIYLKLGLADKTSRTRVIL